MARCRVRDGSCYRNWRRLKASWNWLVRKQAFLWKHELVDWRSPKLENQLYHCCIVSSAYENSIEKKGGKILKITRLPKAALKIGRISLVAIADMFQAVKHVKRMSWEFPFSKRQIDRRYYPTTTIHVVTWHAGLLRFTRHFNLSGEYSVGLIWHIEKLTYPPIWNPLSACSYNQLPNLLSVNIFVNSIWLNLGR